MSDSVRPHRWQPTRLRRPWDPPGKNTGEPQGLRGLVGSVHGVEKSQIGLRGFTFMHWKRKWQPTPVFLPGGSQGRRSLAGYRLWDRTESETPEAT